MSENSRSKRDDLRENTNDIQTGVGFIDTISQVGRTVRDNIMYREARRYVDDVTDAVLKNGVSKLMMELEYKEEIVNIGVGDNVEFTDLTDKALEQLKYEVSTSSSRDIMNGYYHKDFAESRALYDSLGVVVEIDDVKDHHYVSELFEVSGFHAEPEFNGVLYDSVESINGRLTRPYTPDFLKGDDMKLNDEFLTDSNPLYKKRGQTKAYGIEGSYNNGPTRHTMTPFLAHYKNMNESVRKNRTANYDDVTLTVYGPPEVYDYDKGQYKENLRENGGNYHLSDDDYKLTKYQFTGDNLRALHEDIIDMASRYNQEDNITMTQISEGVLTHIARINNNVKGSKLNIKTDELVDIDELQKAHDEFFVDPYKPFNIQGMGYDYRQENLEELKAELENRRAAVNAQTYIELNEEHAKRKESMFQKEPDNDEVTYIDEEEYGPAM